jgi:GDPmannose 4,6-dehydratase
MRRILRLPQADEFIIASGKKHTVLDFVKEVFSRLGLDWQAFVREDSRVLTKKKASLIGDPGKLMRLTGWKPSVDFPGLIEALIPPSADRHSRR